MHEFKKFVHRLPIRVLERAHVTTLIRFGRIMCLRRLIEYQYSGDWTVPLSEPTMQSQVGYYMIPNPILSATDAVEGDWTRNRFSYDGEFLEIEPYAPFGVFQVKGSRIACHMIGDQVEKGIDSFLYILGTQALREHFNPPPGFLDEDPEIIPFVRQVGLIQECADSPDNTCPFNDLITLYTCLFVVRVGTFKITLGRNNRLLNLTTLLAERIETPLKVRAFGAHRLQLFFKHPERTGKIRCRRRRRYQMSLAKWADVVCICCPRIEVERNETRALFTHFPRIAGLLPHKVRRGSNIVLHVSQLPMKGADFVLKPNDRLPAAGDDGRRLEIRFHNAFELPEPQLDVSGFKAVVDKANAAGVENDATNSRMSSVVVGLHGLAAPLQLAQ